MRKHIRLYLIALSASAVAVTACGGGNGRAAATTDEATTTRAAFAKGADVSWLTQIESEGGIFRNALGQEKECMRLLKEDCGVNSIRLRVWVNPADGWNNIDDVALKAQRAHSLGLRLMIDFHFSDTWADPGAQKTPAAWADYDMAQLKAAVAEHVTKTLTKLSDLGIEPEWVQIGNETRTGFLYPLGASSNGQNFTDLVNSAYDAIKAVFPQATAIVHLDCGDKADIYTYIFDILKEYGGEYDMIGMSLYPQADSWQATAEACMANIKSVAATYGKPVMLCEIGMDYREAEQCNQCIAYLMEQGQASGCLEGIFYWEPEAPPGYNHGYNKGCFVGGAPTQALDAFKD